jgi:hypothetical protein
MMHNILWMEDSSDLANARARAAELRQRGFEEAMRSCLGDECLDVRERTKGNLAVWESGASSDSAAAGGAGEGRRAGSGIFGSREREREREREMRDEIEGRAGSGGGGWRA